MKKLLLVCSISVYAASFASAGALRNIEFIQKLQQKYGNRIEFATSRARQTVFDFYLDCKSQDGRVLPLMNVFLAKLSSLDTKDVWLTIVVDSRGEDVRVYDRLVRRDGQIIDSQPVFEINRWGELRSLNGKSEAVRNACFGSHGPIWIIPLAQNGNRAQEAPAGEVKQIINTVDRLNGQCRGGSGDSPKTIAACDERDRLMTRISKAGWCWGPDDAIGAEKSWIKCR